MATKRATRKGKIATVHLDTRIKAELKVRAARRDVSIQQEIHDVLVEALGLVHLVNTRPMFSSPA